MKNVLKSTTAKLGLIGSTFLFSATSFAVDHGAAIDAAGADGTSNTTKAVIVVVGIASVLCGIGAVLKLLGR